MTPAPAEAAPDPWLGFGLALLVLAAAGWVARRRSRPEAAEAAAPPGRFVRIFYSAAAFGAAIALQLGADEAARAGLTWRFLPMIALAAAAFIVIGLVLFGLADVWLGLARPSRSRRWLAAAVAVFVLLIAACFAVAALAMGEPVGSLLDPAMLQIVAIAAAAGLVWWAHLPPPRPDLARRFE